MTQKLWIGLCVKLNRNMKRRRSSTPAAELSQVVLKEDSQPSQKKFKYEPKIISLKGAPERKLVDVDPNVYQVDTAGSLTLLNGCSRGTDITNRIGRNITMTSVFIRGHIMSESASILSPSVNQIGQLARCLIIYDMEALAGTPLITDVLKSATSYAQLNIDNRDRFTVLMDKQWYIGPVAVNSSSVCTVADRTGWAFKKYIKLKHPVVFNNNNNGDFSDINTGGLWMVWIGNVAAGTGTNTVAKVSTRVRFTDQ